MLYMYIPNSFQLTDKTRERKIPLQKRALYVNSFISAAHLISVVKRESTISPFKPYCPVARHLIRHIPSM